MVMRSHTLRFVSNSYYHYHQSPIDSFPFLFTSLFLLNVNLPNNRVLNHTNIRAIQFKKMNRHIGWFQLKSIQFNWCDAKIGPNELQSQRFFFHLLPTTILHFTGRCIAFAKRAYSSRQSVTTWCRRNSWLWDSEIASQGVEVLYIYKYNRYVQYFFTLHALNITLHILCWRFHAIAVMVDCGVNAHRIFVRTPLPMSAHLIRANGCHASIHPDRFDELHSTYCSLLSVFRLQCFTI